LSVDQQYAAAFRRYWGLDVDGRTESEVLERLGQEPEVVVQELIVCLDGWIMERQRQARPEAEWRRLFRLAEQLDRSGQRRQLRAFLVGESLPRAQSVAGLLGEWPPWPALWELARGDRWRRLQQLRREIGLAKEPVLTALLLARTSVAVGDATGAEQVLRQALATRPDQVVLLDALGKLLHRQRRGEAVGCFRAARALRPQLGVELGLILCRARQAADGAGLTEEQRTAWRRQTLDWLRAEVGAWGKRLDGASPEAKAETRKLITYLQVDGWLASVRDTTRLDRLPAAERKDWQKLWAEVDDLLKKAQMKE
jgi:hypothetical protein